METPQEYLSRTKSAVQHLFAGIDVYLQILREGRSPVLVGSYANEAQRDEALEKWMKQNKKEIEKGLDAERAFLSEKYALAALCGSLLQIAAMAIRLYSKNKVVPPEFSDVMKPVAVPYCIGRQVRRVPLGLVIYAGRNQYNHVEDDHLREPSSTVFEWLATNHGYGDGIRDPAFDLRARLVWNYASNVTSLIGWREYESYESDIQSLLRS